MKFGHLTRKERTEVIALSAACVVGWVVIFWMVIGELVR
jgi:hypothetical protein